MDFDGFSKIWCHSAPGPVKQAVAPIETFARSWLATITSIFMIFMDFDGFSKIWCHNAPVPGTTL